MKNFCIAAIFAATCMTSCQNEKVSEIEHKRQELETKRNELKETQELAALSEELKKVERDLEKTNSKGRVEAIAYKSAANPTTGQIKGENVIMRSMASIKSDKLANFSNNELVSILTRSGADNGNEALLTEEMQLYSYTSSGRTPMYKLPKGKAVVIREYLGQNNSYRVSYQHPELGYLEAAVPANLLEGISNQIWFQVRRTNGQAGWVLGKFLIEL
jgi:hypothetical protein